jgi:hypothetical protein
VRLKCIGGSLPGSLKCRQPNVGAMSEIQEGEGCLRFPAERSVLQCRFPSSLVLKGRGDFLRVFCVVGRSCSPIFRQQPVDGCWTARKCLRRSKRQILGMEGGCRPAQPSLGAALYARCGGGILSRVAPLDRGACTVCSDHCRRIWTSGWQHRVERATAGDRQIYRGPEQPVRCASAHKPQSKLWRRSGASRQASGAGPPAPSGGGRCPTAGPGVVGCRSGCRSGCRTQSPTCWRQPVEQLGKLRPIQRDLRTTARHRAG